MKKIRSYSYSIIQGAVFFGTLFTNLYYPLIVILSVTALLAALDKFGKGIILRELIALHSCVICLVMPWIGFEVYTPANELANLWKKYMPIDPDVYFNFALPATAAFVFAISWPIGHRDEGKTLSSKLELVKSILSEKKNVGIYILIIGIIASFIQPYLPDALNYIAVLMFWCSFAGFLYLYFNKRVKRRWAIMTAFVLFIIEKGLNQGMFTVIAYMSITLSSFFYLGTKTPLWKKVCIFVIGFFFLFLIQSVKGTYRQYIWLKGYQGNTAVLFGSLIADKLSKPSELFNEDAFFPMYVRGNQGFNISLVMRRFPSLKEFDYGDNLMRVFAASLVPRFLWPDKPQAGGKFNMEYYTGLIITGFSTNVGPMGEAYGSFGAKGGIVYMFFLGLFIRCVYLVVFKISDNVPLLLCWIPVLFYQVTYSMETDTLQILNTIFKGSFFLWLVYRFKPSLFNVERKKNIRRRVRPIYLGEKPQVS